MPFRSTPAVSAEPFVPDSLSLSRLREASKSCRGCPLWKPATQTVFGEGASKSKVMLIGEQPGDQEDLTGHPFVGPAGRLLDAGLQQAGFQRDQVYLTNAVKHFKFEPRGKRRIHKKPNSMEVRACYPWLEAEIRALAPRIIVCLGATAAQSLLGGRFRVTQSRGEWVPSSLAPFVLATVHPSSLLRAPDAEARRRGFEAFVRDLSKVRAVLAA